MPRGIIETLRSVDFSVSFLDLQLISGMETLPAALVFCWGSSAVGQECMQDLQDALLPPVPS